MKALLVVCCLVFPGYPAHADEAMPLTLATYNIHAGFPMGKSSRNHKVTQDDLQNIADVLTSSGAAVIGLQEVHCELQQFAPPAKQISSALNQPRQLASRLQMKYVFASTIDDPPAYAPNPAYLEWGAIDQWSNNFARHGEFGNAVLTTLDLASTPTSFALPRRDNQEQRGCVRVELETTAGQRLVIYNTHLQHDDQPTRVDQLDFLLERAAAEATGTLVFVLGDLNWADKPDGPMRRDWNNLLTRFGFYDLGRGNPQPTIPADAPDRRIDYILCNRDLKVIEAKTIATPASDHLPVVVTVELGK